MLLNSTLTADASRAFANRVQQLAGNDPRQQVRFAFELALQRQPDEVESTACATLLSEQSLVELCRALVNLNEFVYLD
jgi:hypothetical protein